MQKVINFSLNEKQWAIVKAQAEYECRSVNDIAKSSLLQYVMAHKHIIKDKVIYNPFTPQLPDSMRFKK